MWLSIDEEEIFKYSDYIPDIGYLFYSNEDVVNVPEKQTSWYYKISASRYFNLLRSPLLTALTINE